jgi:coenzyme F420-reducing hydrogenase alpha subunit
MLYEEKLENERQQQRKELRQKAQAVVHFAQEKCNELARLTHPDNLLKLWDAGNTDEILSIANKDAIQKSLMAMCQVVEAEYNRQSDHINFREVKKLRDSRLEYNRLRTFVENHVGEFMRFEIAKKNDRNLAMSAFRDNLFILGSVSDNVRRMLEIAKALHYTEEHLAWLNTIGLTPAGQILEEEAPEAD